MNVNPSADPQQAYRKQKHQMSVTHSSLGLHSRATPGTVRGFEAVHPRLAPWKNARSDASRKKWRQRNELGTNLAAMRRKRSEYAQLTSCPHSQGLHERNQCP
jgi:hypothetical protein